MQTDGRPQWTMLEDIIAEARRMGFTRLSLETGSAEAFRPARKLYEKFGFAYCEPFADYRPDPRGVFLTRTLLADRPESIGEVPLTAGPRRSGPGPETGRGLAAGHAGRRADRAGSGPAREPAAAAGRSGRQA